MLRYLPGIFLIQVISVVLAYLHGFQFGAMGIKAVLQLLVPMLVLGVTTALWFDHIGRARAQRHVEKLKESHAKDREKLHKQTEKEKDRVRAEAQKAIRRESRRVNTKANLKTFLSLAVAGGAGLLLLFTELFTLGMMTLMTASGAMGGYLWRASRESVSRAGLDTTGHSDALSSSNDGVQGKPVVVGEGTTQNTDGTGSVAAIERTRH